MKPANRLGEVAGRILPQVPQDRLAWLAALLTALELLLLPFVIHLDGRPHADWEQFLGRFHPLAVHLPIGLVVLVPVLELMGEMRPALREAAGFVLAFACAAAIGALALGFLLAHGSGESGEMVTRHMWGGIALAIGLLLSLLARPLWYSGAVRFVYPATLALSLVALIWTADLGGSITHGSSYLTRYMPAPMKRFFGFGQAEPDSASFYTRQIHPVFDANCVACHGAGKTEGGLRLDSFAALMLGGKDGAVIAPGKPQNSLLLARVTLPTGDPHAMPAEGRPPLKPQQIASIRAWIEQGASPTVATLTGISLPQEQKEPPPQPVGDYSALMPEIRDLQKGLGAKLVPVSSKPSDGLVLHTVDAASSFGDAQLAQLERFAPYIVEAELGRTAITDASFDTLAKFTHLRALHLEDTAVTGAGLAKLRPLSQLVYLNLSGTRVTQANLAPLASMKSLHHLYLFNTPAQPAAGSSAAQAASGNSQ